MNVDDLCENKTYSADSVEVALVFNPEKAKVAILLTVLFHCSCQCVTSSYSELSLFDKKATVLF